MRTMLDFLNDFSKVLGHGHALRHVPQSWRSIWQLNGGWQLAGQSRNLVYGWNNEAWYKFGLAGWEPATVPIDPDTGESFRAIPDRALVHKTTTGRLQIAAWEEWDFATLKQHAIVTAYAGPAPGRALMSMRVSAVAWQDAAAYAKVYEFRLHDWKPEDEARPDRLYLLGKAAQLLEVDVDPVLVGVAMYRDKLMVVDAYDAEKLFRSIPAFLIAEPLEGLKVVSGLRGSFADRWMVLCGEQVIRRGLHSEVNVWELFPGVEARPISSCNLNEHERLILSDDWPLCWDMVVVSAGRPGYPRENVASTWAKRQAERDRYGEVMPK